MFTSIIGKLTNNNDYKLSLLKPVLQKINELEAEVSVLQETEIRQKTVDFQKILRDPSLSETDISNKVEEILPYAFALVRESAKRVMNQRHRDVQILAGIALHQGKIAEQKTGEGKTLTATLPLYLNSLAGRGVHLVTPNDYLAKHGAGWYGEVYRYLGVTVGVITDQASYVYDPEYIASDEIDKYSIHLKPVTRKLAYACDITYGTNSQFGFDYLRDNMVADLEKVMQINPLNEYWAHNFAIVDEVDSILIDVARTPLIISSQQDQDVSPYVLYKELADWLVKKTDYTVDEKHKQVTLTEIGISKIERRLNVPNLYETSFDTIHKIENAVRAKELYEKDKDYVIQNGEVLIVDQFTGRILQSNRWSDGLHQAVEAKENLQIKSESKTVATVSYQNYFRLYKKLAGMTGTAMTESEELFKIYSLDVVSIPTHKPVMRKDYPDLIFKTETAKYRAIARDISERFQKGQPVLIGTVSVEKSQLLSTYLKKLNIPHQILNAKNHAKEALIIAQAGKSKSVTVATNMAGRGVDIILGGDPFDEKEYSDVIHAGGLYVIGTERHESRRIDNQLRGRAGRQGDAGESRFYLSLQDELMRLFGGDKIGSVMNTLKVDENMPIESKIISRTIEGAQKKVESMNFESRKQLVDMDDIMDIQRNTIYDLRKKILINSHGDKNDYVAWLSEKFKQKVTEIDIDKINKTNIDKYGIEVWVDVLTKVVLETIDMLWMDHIDTMDDLRNAVRLRNYGQVDPLVEYKKEGRELFDILNSAIWNTSIDRLSKIEVNVIYQNKPNDISNQTKEISETSHNYGVSDEADLIMQDGQNLGQTKEPIKKAQKPGRNEPCWCGSGKKYKSCHWPN